MPKTLDKSPKICGEPIEYILFLSTGGDFLLPVNPGGHAAYQNFVATNLRKYYPNPDAFSPATWDIIKRFWNLDLSYTDDLLR